MKPLSDELKKTQKNLSEESACKMPEVTSLAQMKLWFDEKLRQIIPPKDQSDRTSFRRISNWLVRGINEKKFGVEIFETVLHYAKEASEPDCRNPAAVFTTILKEELGYKK